MEFLENQNQMWIDALEEDVKQALYDGWINSNSDEGDAYVENRLMSFASTDMQQKYNDHYGLTMDDDFYFVHPDKWDEFIAYQNRNLK
jgi:hypothetical protein